MIIWEYRFEDKTKLELIRPLTGVELIKMWEKHGYVVVDFRVEKEVRDTLRENVGI